MYPRGPKLNQLVLDTLKQCSDIVGSSLGPGGRVVVIERQETQLAPLMTKDGVTIFRNLGFSDPTQQVLMEVAREPSIKTASDAGDGPQPMWSKVLTPNGFVTMKDLVVGMDVCGTDGTIQKVLGIYPKGKKEIVKIKFEGGQVVECCEDHLWEVTTSYGTSKTLTVKQLKEDFKKQDSNGSNSYKYYVPKTTVNFAKEAGLPLDPYLVAVLIGDGSLCDSGSVELCLGAKKEHILKKLTLPEGLMLKSTWVEDKNSFRVKIQGQTSDGKTIRNLLEEIGLRNTDSRSKHIPKTYLMGSVDTRKKILQGLIDTDGYVNVRGRFEFSTVSEQLASDFEFLVRSLGKSIYKKLHTRENDAGSYSKKPIYRFNELKGNMYGEKIVDIQPTGVFTDMQCIKVSNPDHLYITDDFVVTHNTTSATILSYAFVKHTQEFHKKDPSVSPQRVMRIMEKMYTDVVVPEIKKVALKPSLTNDEGRRLLHAVANISANGDKELADAVLECYDIVGDEGNVTILEESGSKFGYRVERVDGYPVLLGFEDCCGPFYDQFINDEQTQSSRIENPVFVLYHGKITDFSILIPVLTKLEVEIQSGKIKPAIVVVAHDFSQDVLANFAKNFKNGMKIFPLKTQVTGTHNSQYEFLKDIAALTGGTIADDLTLPLQDLELPHIGIGPTVVECGRFRTNIIGYKDELLVLERVDELNKQYESAATSDYDKTWLRERIAKLSSGIAKLIVLGSAGAVTKEKRDRAEDAICAVRGALKYGAVFGGGATLKHLSKVVVDAMPEGTLEHRIASEVFAKALMEPVDRLFLNSGFLLPEQREEIINQISSENVFDLLNEKWVNPLQMGILDSVPAVRDAIGNSLSTASLLGTCGATICFKRDSTLESLEAKSGLEWERDTPEESMPQ